MEEQMSRTIRRKNEKWLANRYDYYPRHQFYGDSGPGRWSVPRWYRKMKCEDRRKRFNQAEMDRVLRDPDYEPLFAPIKRDSGWFWW
jgi:hypothetical protein